MPVTFIKVSAEDSDIRLDRWFKRHFQGVSHIAVEKALRKGNIRVNGKRVQASLRLKEGDEIRVPPFKIDPIKKIKSPAHEIISSGKAADMMLDSVIYTDKNIIAINKPSGLAVQGGSKISVSVDHLLHHLQFEAKEKPKLIHRLDKDTSGVLLLARNSKTAALLTKLFKDKQIKKEYLAITVGTPKPKHGVIDLPLIKSGVEHEKVIVSEEGQEAITHYKVLENFANSAALVSLSPLTGRTHQLRVHMQSLGTPILGDNKYGGNKMLIDGKKVQLHLHAQSIVIPNFEGQRIVVKADLPQHFQNTLDYFDINL